MAWESNSPEAVAALNVEAQLAAAVFNCATIITALSNAPNDAVRDQLTTVIDTAMEQLSAHRAVLTG